MNSGVNKLPEPYGDATLWAKWLRATGVDHGHGYRVPEEVWNAAWQGNWPDDEDSIRWILEEYLDVETAKAHGYLELVLPLREQAEAALDAAKDKVEQQRQIKIDADIDEVIRSIRALGCEPDDHPSTSHSCGDKPTLRRGGWIGSVISVIAVAVAVLAGFAGGYSVRALNHPGDATVALSPEIRRAIPVEPEIRRAIAVEPEIRKAIPVHITSDRQAGLRAVGLTGARRQNSAVTK
jgi:hypothetical protein